MRKIDRRRKRKNPGYRSKQAIRFLSLWQQSRQNRNQIQFVERKTLISDLSEIRSINCIALKRIH